MYRENDVVRLTHTMPAGSEAAWPGLPAEALPPGSIGAIVMVYPTADGNVYEVEFVAEYGSTRALLTLGDADLEPFR